MVLSPSCSSCSYSPSSSSSHGSAPPSSTGSSFNREYHRESLIPRHSLPPTSVVSLSSLRDLTATSSTYNIPTLPSTPSSSSPSSPSPSEFPSPSSSTSRPIPIPKPTPTAAARDQHLPVTPLTGRFDKGYRYYYPSPEEPSSHERYNRHCHHNRHHQPCSSMRCSDSSNFYSSIASPTMTSSARPSSPQQSRSRPQNSTKSVPAFHLSNLPRYHPGGTGSQTTVGQPSSSAQSRQHTYRQSSGSSSRDGMWQYRELMESVTAPRTTSGQHSPSPSAPRLDPLNSPGPVTPLVLEETSSYLASGSANTTEASRGPSNSGPAPDLVERLIAREAERSRQKGNRMGTKSR